MPRLLRSVLAVSALATGLLAAVAVPVQAHTEVSRATPGPGDTVTAGVGSVELVFLDPVLPEVEIGVTDDDGRTVDGLRDVEVSEGATVATVRFDPLDEGRYVVRYAFVAEDGDRREDGYQFSVEADEGGLSPALTAAVLGAVLVTMAAVAFRRRETQHES